MVTEKLTPPPSARVTGASFAGCCVSVSEVLAEFPSEFSGADIFGFVSVLASFAGASSILSGAEDTAFAGLVLAEKGASCAGGVVLRGPASVAISALFCAFGLSATARGSDAIK